MNYIVDCGFSVGGFSWKYLLRLQEAGEDMTNWTVIGFEPDDRWPLDYRREIIFRDFPSVKIEVHDRTAVWTSDGTMTYQSCIGKSSGHLAATKPARRESGRRTSYEVPTVDLDRLLKGLHAEKIVLKMDIEGGEYYVLPHIQKNGSALLLSETYIEYHLRLNPAWKNIHGDIMLWWVDHPEIKHHVWR